MIAAGVFFGAPIPCQMEASNPGTNSATAAFRLMCLKFGTKIELQGLFRRIYRKDSRASALNIQRSLRNVRCVRQ
jgi:hypothetical protein